MIAHNLVSNQLVANFLHCWAQLGHSEKIDNGLASQKVNLVSTAEERCVEFFIFLAFRCGSTNKKIKLCDKTGLL